MHLCNWAGAAFDPGRRTVRVTLLFHNPTPGQIAVYDGRRLLRETVREVPAE